MFKLVELSEEVPKGHKKLLGEKGYTVNICQKCGRLTPNADKVCDVCKKKLDYEREYKTSNPN